MIIHYFAYLRDCTHRSTEEYHLPVETLGDLLRDLSRRYGLQFRKWVLTPDGELCEIAILLVNGRDVRDGLRLETPLSPDDEICIFPPVAGG